MAEYQVCVDDVLVSKLIQGSRFEQFKTKHQVTSPTSASTEGAEAFLVWMHCLEAISY